ncbi:GL15309 [Drosophila persimilis]|uniref:GL15309 n=1 Tax=Drosophila persimilis TaxID=7234 RepID=B4H9D1_DROPE|nr:GL15309 [Drosophila persimilis]
MLEMRWDRDLAKVAEAAVRLCRLEKLWCATTPIYMWTGQNEALDKSDCLRSSDLVIRKHLDEWIRQGDYARMNHLTDPFSGRTLFTLFTFITFFTCVHQAHQVSPGAPRCTRCTRFTRLHQVHQAHQLHQVHQVHQAHQLHQVHQAYKVHIHQEDQVAQGDPVHQ